MFIDFYEFYLILLLSLLVGKNTKLPCAAGAEGGQDSGGNMTRNASKQQMGNRVANYAAL